MIMLVADCPRCTTKSITFDVSAVQLVGAESQPKGAARKVFEAFAVCRNCFRSVTFVIRQRSDAAKLPLDTQGSLNNSYDVIRFVNVKDLGAVAPPEHIPDNIEKIFREGATCLKVECWNAAGTMFRTCVDLATRPLLPEGEAAGLSSKTRRDLGLRLPWLFENRQMPNDLRGLSTAIREDGNDGAHEGTLTREDAEDLLDFTTLLERIYTQPKQLELAEERRTKRRESKE
jgi:Domain of unknown function (DUF4145)